ncbi:MAG TPA: Ig-like domain-containing protein [Verrucomicrobiae bacterium]|jgi:hypothetical protein|nr:Ig-like domain-containing protein [Verrucomicrobiae bacterium]
MKPKLLAVAICAGLALCLPKNASAWPDFAWTGLGNDGMWNNPANWTNLDNLTASLPESDVAGGAVQIDQANGWSQVTISSGYTVDLDYENPTAYYNTVFGGEFGMAINIKGTLEYGWMMAPVQNDPNPAVRTLINMYSGSVLQTQGAGLGIGDAWWWYQAAPYVTLNMYGNAQMNVPNIGLGGHLNIYDTAVANVSVNVFTGNPLANGTGNASEVCCSDGTASLNLGGGTLILPAGYTTNAFAGNDVYDLIGRGVLRAYGKGYDTNDLVINDNVVTVVGTNSVTNAVVTAVPLGGALQRVYFTPMLHSSVQMADFQQLILVGDYPSVSGVLLSSSEPGLDPASFSHPVYSSSNPNVATIDTNGMVTAVSPGSATLTAKVGALSTTNSLTITVNTGTATLIHRYSFASDASDSVGTANGILNGDASVSSGQLVLSGNVNSSVILPSGILSGLDEITVEAWVSFPSTINAFANLCAFGYSDTTPLDTYIGSGGNYITFSPHTGGSTAQANFGQGLPGSAGERDAVQGGVYDGLTNLLITIVYHPYAGTEAFYTNGVLCVSVSMFNDMIDPVGYAGPTFNDGSILNYTLGLDSTNFIGQSLYTADPGLLANIDEFRIYNGALSPSQIAADLALGPNQARGSNTNVKLSVVESGSNVVCSWPTSSAAVTLLSSPVLGPNAVWTPVAMPKGAMVVSGPNYSVTLPSSGGGLFFRLSN